MAFLQSFYNTPVLHRIRTLTITKPTTLRQGQRQDELDISMVIEAVIVDGVKPRETLMPKEPLKAEYLTAKRNYNDILARNIFLGPNTSSDPGRINPVEITKYNKLTTVVQNHWSGKVEAFFRDLAAPNPSLEVRLRPSAGFDEFAIKDGNGESIVKGKVIKIDVDNREVYFKVGDKYYRIHTGQSFEQAMRKASPRARSRPSAWCRRWSRPRRPRSQHRKHKRPEFPGSRRLPRCSGRLRSWIWGGRSAAVSARLL